MRSSEHDKSIKLCESVPNRDKAGTDHAGVCQQSSAISASAKRTASSLSQQYCKHAAATEEEVHTCAIHLNVISLVHDELLCNTTKRKDHASWP